VRVGRGGLEAVRPRRGSYALARVFPRVTLAAPADGVRMLVCPSSHRTRTRRGSSWSTSSITPARLGWTTFSDSTTIPSPGEASSVSHPPVQNLLVLLERLARPSSSCPRSRAYPRGGDSRASAIWKLMLRDHPVPPPSRPEEDQGWGIGRDPRGLSLGRARRDVLGRGRALGRLSG
jgi:hypothetical protein